MKHTPTPWKCFPVNSMTVGNNRTFEIHGFETNQYVRDVLPTEVEANAKLIVTAVNNHAELLEALRGAHSVLLMASLIDKSSLCGDTCDKIKAVIDKAEANT